MADTEKKLTVFDLKGASTENVQLDAGVFDGKVNKTLLYEVIKMYNANRRRGCASTKTRSEVSGGGAKPWRQKGTGRARVGSSRNPLWRHGGVAFGPRPRNFGHKMPKKARNRALVSVLNARLNEGVVKPVVSIEMDEPRTSRFREMLENLEVNGKVLVVVDRMNDTVKLSARNLKNVTLRRGRNLNARDVLLNENIVIEKDALIKLCERLK